MHPLHADQEVRDHQHAQCGGGEPNSPHHLRIHRSYLVDLRKVTAVQEGYVRIGAQNIPVGKTYAIALMALDPHALTVSPIP